LLDGSPSVTEEEFQAELNFSLSFASKLYVDPDKIQLGLSIFAHEHVTYQTFENNVTLEDFNDAVLPATRPQATGNLYYGFIRPLFPLKDTLLAGEADSLYCWDKQQFILHRCCSDGEQLLYYVIL